MGNHSLASRVSPLTALLLLFHAAASYPAPPCKFASDGCNLIKVPVCYLVQIAGRKARFDVLLTSYDFMMGKADRPRLAKLTWDYIIIDEGHRLKNAGCKLNAEIKMYTAHSRLLLTGFVHAPYTLS